MVWMDEVLVSGAKSVRWDLSRGGFASSAVYVETDTPEALIEALPQGPFELRLISCKGPQTRSGRRLLGAAWTKAGARLVLAAFLGDEGARSFGPFVAEVSP